MSYRVISCSIRRGRPTGGILSSKFPLATCSFHRNYQSLSSRERNNIGQWNEVWKVKKNKASYSQFSSNNQSNSYFKSKYLLGANSRLDSQFLNNISSSQGNYRGFSNSTILYKEESNVEKSVKHYKEQTDSVEKNGKNSKSTDVEVKKSLSQRFVAMTKSIWQGFVALIKHYYNGFRLLFIDVKISSRLLYRVLNGQTLSRREKNQLVRTTADLFRLVPFLVFLIVPFLEFLLPVALKLFPNMLPSTFAEANKEQEKLKKQLKIKLEMAKFLQETVHESALQGKKPSKLAKEFSNFVNNIREKGLPVATKDIVEYSKLFEDEITLDTLSREQLRALCTVLGIQPIGIDSMLRFQLQMKLRKLKTDDKMIVKEGIDTLTMSELQSACRARGMRALGLSEPRLKFQLQQWLDLNLNEKIPPSLLLLSRALYLPDNLSTTEQLKATISSLPETTTSETIVKVAELTGDKIDNKAKLDLIKNEEAVIAKEQQQKTMEEMLEQQNVIEAAEAKAAQQQMEAQDILQDDALDVKPAQGEILNDSVVIEENVDNRITSKDLEDIESALEEIVEQKRLSIDEGELEDLKENVNEYKEDLEDLKTIMVATGDVNNIQESKAAKRLAKRVDRMIKKLDGMTGKMYEEKEKFQEDIELREVKMKRSSEVRDDEELMKKYQKEINRDKANIISINEMVLGLKRLQKVPNETRNQQIVEVLDEDRDGNIDVNLVLKVIEQIGKENVKLDSSQLSEIIDLIKREEAIEEEEKMKEKREKEKQQQEQKQQEQKQQEQKQQEVKVQ